MSEANSDVLKYFEAVELDSLDERIQHRVKFATELFTELARLMKSITLYGSQHQSSLNFRNRFFEALTRGLLVGDAITVEVQTYALVMAEQIIYENPKIENNFIYRFYTDGIRSLTFMYGITAEEVDELLDIFLLDWNDPTLFEDDAVTLMWSKHFEHIKYTVTPQSQNTEEQVETHLLSLSKQLDRLSDLVNTCDKGVAFTVIDHLLHHAQQPQVKQLTQINQRELLEKLIALSHASQQGLYKDKIKGKDYFLQILDQLALLFSKRGDVSELERFLRQAFRIASDHQQQLIELWSNPRLVQSIMTPLYENHNTQILSSFACLTLLGSSSTPHIVANVGKVAENNLNTLSKLIITHLHDYPIEVCRAIRSGEYTQGKRLIDWSFQSQKTSFLLKVFQTASDHEDQGVRYEALANIPKMILKEDSVLDIIYKGIEDEYSKVRSLSLYTLSYASHPAIPTYAQQMMQDKNTQSLDLVDLRKMYAVAALQGIDPKIFYNLAQKKTALLGKQKDQKYAAIIGLALSKAGANHQDFFKQLVHKRLNTQQQQQAAQWSLIYLKVKAEQRRQMVYELFFRGTLSLPRGVSA